MHENMGKRYENNREKRIIGEMGEISDEIGKVVNDIGDLIEEDVDMANQSNKGKEINTMGNALTIFSHNDTGHPQPSLTGPALTTPIHIDQPITTGPSPLNYTLSHPTEAQKTSLLHFPQSIDHNQHSTTSLLNQFTDPFDFSLHQA